MTTRKKLQKMARRRAAKAREKTARRAWASTARSIARSLPANAFATREGCREELRRRANDAFLSGDPVPTPEDRREVVERLFSRAEHLILPELAGHGRCRE